MSLVKWTEITFDGVDVEQQLSDDDARVDEHDRTEERLDLVATQELDDPLSSTERENKQTPPKHNNRHLYVAAAADRD